MSNFDEFRFSFRDSSAEQRLVILRSESHRYLPIILGYAELLRREFEQLEASEKSDELKNWLSKVIDSAQITRDLIDALTVPQSLEGRGLPELRPYESLLEAIRETAQKLSLPLAKAIDDTASILIHSQYPLVLLGEPKRHREIRFALVKSGYSVELLSLAENRMFQVEYQVSLSTLNDVAIVINQWLLEQRTASEIQKAYPLSKDGG
jgi:hypothetical protein